MFDVIVIGAGASGSHVAERLARRAHRVLVIEKKADAGLDICCTGIVGRECLELLDVDQTLVHRTARAARFFAPSGRSLRLERSEPVAWVLDRAALDRSLRERARRAGAEYLFSTRVTHVEHRDSHLVVGALSEGRGLRFSTKSLVIAAGYGSGLPRGLGMGQIRDLLIGAQAEVDGVTAEEVEVYADQTLAPGGFAWLVPTRDGRGLAGLVTRRDHQRRLDALLERLHATGRIASTDCCRSYGAIPIRPRPATYADRILLVGDAAGQVKPTTGGGIYYGALCGDIAAQVLHEGLETGRLTAAHLSTYQRLWRRRLARELTVGYVAHRLWRRLDNDDLETLFDLAVRSRVTDLIAASRHFSFDWHGPLLMQIAGWLPTPPKRTSGSSFLYE